MSEQTKQAMVPVPQDGRYALVYLIGEDVVQMSTASGARAFTGDGFVVYDDENAESVQKSGDLQDIPPLFVAAVNLVMEHGWVPLGGVVAGNLAFDFEKIVGFDKDMVPKTTPENHYTKILSQAFVREQQ